MNIAYFPAGDTNFASSRMRVYRIADHLRALGHTIAIGDAPAGTEVAIFQKRFDLMPLMRDLRAQGVRVIWDCDDYIAGGPIHLADVITVDTPYKRRLYPRAVVVPDALDLDAGHPVKREHCDELDRVVWFGNLDNLYHVEPVAIACRIMQLQLVIITQTDHPKFIKPYAGAIYLPWNAATVDEQVVHGDVVVCPYIVEGGQWSSDWVLSKSANRVLKAWALGMPVIGSPIPAYRDEGLTRLASTPYEYCDQLIALLPPQERALEGQIGRSCAAQYTADKVADQWMEVFVGESVASR